MNRLSGKHILITGASQGLGRQMALDFARENAAALVLTARHREPREAVRQEVAKISPNTRVVVIEADVSRAKDVERSICCALSCDPRRIQSAYEEAVRRRYLWHEFGHLNLIA